MNKTKTTLATAAAAILLLAGCGSYNDKRGYGDAPVGKKADLPWDIQQAPDGYGNVATRCSSFVDGWRLWQVTGSQTDPTPVVTRDETCKADQP